MTRRKSRPLEPDEVIANFYSSQGYSYIAPSSGEPGDGRSQQQELSSQGSIISSQATAVNLSFQLSAPNLSSESVANSATSPKIVPTSDGLETKLSAENASCNSTGMTGCVESTAAHVHSRPTTFNRSLSQTLPTKTGPGYFANRRSASFMIHDDGLVVPLPVSDEQKHDTPGTSLPSSAQSLKRTSSVIRLSMSLNGKAEVTTRTGNTPSPPRSQPALTNGTVPRAKFGLQRCHSALEPTIRTPEGLSSIPFPKRPMTGRSRDTRTWEFFCDSEARNALTEQAELEESGSATATINLIRSCSQSKKTNSLTPYKRHAQAQKPDLTKRLRPDGRKPTLARTTSSVARLQTTSNETQKYRNRAITLEKSKLEMPDTLQEYDGDSDKENWLPGTHARNPPRRKPTNGSQASRVLEENSRVPSQFASLDALMQRESLRADPSSIATSSTKIMGSSSPDVEIEDINSIGLPPPGEVEDLDCVQSLLSLSQAAWQ